MDTHPQFQDNISRRGCIPLKQRHQDMHARTRMQVHTTSQNCFRHRKLALDTRACSDTYAGARAHTNWHTVVLVVRIQLNCLYPSLARIHCRLLQKNTSIGSTFKTTRAASVREHVHTNISFCMQAYMIHACMHACIFVFTVDKCSRDGV